MDDYFEVDPLRNFASTQNVPDVLGRRLKYCFAAIISATNGDIRFSNKLECIPVQPLEFSRFCFDKR